jgi:hypothetical protein
MTNDHGLTLRPRPRPIPPTEPDKLRPSRVIQRDPARAARIRHIALCVNDIKATADFCEKASGFRARRSARHRRQELHHEP